MKDMRTNQSNKMSQVFKTINKRFKPEKYTLNHILVEMLLCKINLKIVK